LWGQRDGEPGQFLGTAAPDVAGRAKARA